MVKITLYNCVKKYDEESKTYILYPKNNKYKIKIDGEQNFYFDIKSKNKIIIYGKNYDNINETTKIDLINTLSIHSYIMSNSSTNYIQLTRTIFATI